MQVDSAIELALEDGARLLGPDPTAGHEPQLPVPAGAWQSATRPARTVGRSPMSRPRLDFADFGVR